MSRGSSACVWCLALICRPRTGPTKPEASKLCWSRVRFLKRRSQIRSSFQASHPATIRGYASISRSKPSKIAQRACRQQAYYSAGSTTRSLPLWEKVQLTSTFGPSRNLHPFRRSYHVVSSNSDQSYSCQTRVPCRRAAAAAASAPSGDLNHRQTNKGGSPEGPGDFFPTRPQPPSALKHDAAPAAVPPAHLLASDSRDSVEIKLLHAP